jgi:hypothetical protein
MTTKRQNVFRDEFATEFPHIKRSKKGNTFVYCNLCSSDINIEKSGKAQISRHVATDKHAERLRENASSSTLNNFVKRDTPLDLQTAAAEGAFAYHTVKHHQSFR